MSVWQTILERLRDAACAHVTVVDPADQSPDEAAEIATMAEGFGTDALFVGGSTDVTFDAADATVRAIQRASSLPVVHFGRADALSPACDAVLFLSVLNSRDVRLVVGEHVATAPAIRRLGLETISAGYVIVEPGMTVGRAADARLVSRDRPEEAVAYGLTAEMFGMSLLFLEAGSGAPEPVPEAMVRAVTAEVGIPVLVSGGVDSPERAAALGAAGADIIGTGTLAENRDFERLRDVIAAFKQSRRSP